MKYTEDHKKALLDTVEVDGGKFLLDSMVLAEERADTYFRALEKLASEITRKRRER